jgi:type VI secretion system protein ImpA
MAPERAYDNVSRFRHSGLGGCMASPAVIDIEALLAPISESAPVGVDPRADTSPSSVYFKLKDARGAARAGERRTDSEGGETGVVAEWSEIRELAPRILTTVGKDLEVVAWYIEALVRTDGFAGFRDGYRVAATLCERYWDTFHSLPQDEEGLESRLAPLAGLNGFDGSGALIQQLRKVPITAETDLGAFSTYQYEQAFALSLVADEAARARREAAGAVTLEQFNQAVAASGGAFYINLLDDLGQAAEAFETITALLDAKAGAASPPSSSLRDLLQTITGTVRNISGDLVARELQSRPQATTEPAVAEAAAEPAAPAGAGPPRGREEALQHLLRLADYFKHHEPHSPISTTLEEVVRRARLPFSELLAELVPDATAWRTALTNAGIKPPTE